MSHEGLAHPSENPRRIGNMNGPWAFAFKIALATYPMFLAWGIWVSKDLFSLDAWRGEGARFTTNDGEILRSKVKDDVRAERAVDYAHLEAKIDSISAVQITLRESIFELRADFRHMIEPKK